MTEYELLTPTTTWSKDIPHISKFGPGRRVGREWARALKQVLADPHKVCWLFFRNRYLWIPRLLYGVSVGTHYFGNTGWGPQWLKNTVSSLRKCTHGSGISGFYRVKYHKLDNKRDRVGGDAREPILISSRSILNTQNTEIPIFEISMCFFCSGGGERRSSPPPITRDGEDLR